MSSIDNYKHVEDVEHALVWLIVSFGIASTLLKHVFVLHRRSYSSKPYISPYSSKQARDFLTSRRACHAAAPLAHADQVKWVGSQAGAAFLHVLAFTNVSI